jgi:hypothetical protein
MRLPWLAWSFFLPDSERKAMETTGKHWQVPMPFLAEVRARQADPVHIAAMADTGAVRFAIQSSGHDDYEVAEAKRAAA